jgi:hypothetical protein
MLWSTLKPVFCSIPFICLLRGGVCILFEYEHYFTLKSHTLKAAVKQISESTEAVSDFGCRVVPAVCAALTDRTLEVPEV